MEKIIGTVAEISGYLYKRKLVPGKSGNVSFRFNDGDVSLVAITPTGFSLKNIEKKDVVLVEMNGNILNGDSNPSSELIMHIKIYENRDDINGIVHTHSPFATGFSLSERRLERLEGFGEITNMYYPVVDYSAPGSRKLAEETSKIMETENVVILKNHGVVACGSDLDEAALLAEFIEEVAKTQFVGGLLSLK
ncbi:MAG: class II aldolase/adducin family protein [Euryarchaeota archaeon]|nr:class II aldolase/adducin family protein [Euryarchaeota archaeon]